MENIILFVVCILFIAIGIFYLITVEKDQRKIIDSLEKQRRNQLPLDERFYLEDAIKAIKCVRYQGLTLFIADLGLMLVYFDAKNFVLADIWSKILVVVWSTSAFLFLIVGIKAIWICKKLL